MRCGCLRILLTAPAWLAGFGLMLCGFGLQVVALTLAPVSVVQPVLGSGVVILLVLSRIVLRETLKRLELACVLAMATAIVVIALSATGQAGHVGHQASGVLLAAVALPAGAIAAGLGASALRPGPIGRHRMPSIGVSYAVASGLFYGVATLAIKAMAGSLGQHGGLDASLLLAVAASPYPYVTVASSALGMLIFQTGLQRCRVSIVGPVSNITRQRVLHRGRDLAVRGAAARGSCAAGAQAGGHRARRARRGRPVQETAAGRRGDR